MYCVSYNELVIRETFRRPVHGKFNNNAHILLACMFVISLLSNFHILSLSYQHQMKWFNLNEVILIKLFRARHSLQCNECIPRNTHQPKRGLYESRNPNSTITTKAPVFGGYPQPPHDYSYYWFMLDPKSKQGQVEAPNLKNLPKL